MKIRFFNQGGMRGRVHAEIEPHDEFTLRASKQADGTARPIDVEDFPVLDSTALRVSVPVCKGDRPSPEEFSQMERKLTPCSVPPGSSTRGKTKQKAGVKKEGHRRV